MNEFSEEEMEEFFVYLDELRESGDTNMYGAGSYLEDEFSMNRKTASYVLKQWMDTFSERHPE